MSGAVVLGICAFPSLARADSTGAAADKAFRDGNALAAAGKYADACPKLAESQKLDPAVGTEFNLADCYEHIDRTATAYALFVEVVKIAHEAGKIERERIARARAEALLPRVPHLKLDVQAAAAGFAVKLDDADVAVTTEPIATDPGPHTVVASAPNRTTWTGTVSTTDGATATLTIPELVDPNPPPPPAIVPATEPAPMPPVSRRYPGKLPARIALGVGVAGLAVGTFAGVFAISKKSDANRVCPSALDDFHCPTQAGAADWNSAQTTGTVSTVGFIVGGVALAAAIVLWVTAPSSTKPVTTAWAF